MTRCFAVLGLPETCHRGGLANLTQLQSPVRQQSRLQSIYHLCTRPSPTLHKLLVWSRRISPGTGTDLFRTIAVSVHTFETRSIDKPVAVGTTRPSSCEIHTFEPIILLMQDVTIGTVQAGYSTSGSSLGVGETVPPPQLTCLSPG